ncbi:MAG: MepB family protein, partial [Carnobacterium sp.]
KRGFRVYPLWDQPDNPQAIQTQKWQLNYFLDLTQGSQQLNAKSIQRLYNI